MLTDVFFSYKKYWGQRFIAAAVGVLAIGCEVSNSFLGLDRICSKGSQVYFFDSTYLEVPLT